jgi:predicted PurR-regulated permease PerM
MTEKQTAFLEKIKTLSSEDLLKYKTAAIQVKRVIGAIGILCVFTMLVFPVLLILGAPLVYFLAKTSSNIHISLLEITGLLRQRTKADK